MFRFIVPLVLLLGLAKAGKRRKIINHLSGKTPSEARALIVAKASQKAGAERAEAIADRLVSKLETKGVLAPEPV